MRPDLPTRMEGLYPEKWASRPLPEFIVTPNAINERQRRVTSRTPGCLASGLATYTANLCPIHCGGAASHSRLCTTILHSESCPHRMQPLAASAALKPPVHRLVEPTISVSSPLRLARTDILDNPARPESPSTLCWSTADSSEKSMTLNCRSLGRFYEFLRSAIISM
jgi:hypothetical protein